MKCLPLLLLVICLLASCRKPTPRETFGTAVLNSNLMHGFAGEDLRSELAQPSTKLEGPNYDREVPMKRMEIIDTKIANLEAAFDKLKKLPADEDSREMLQASTALYEFVLPVYRNEYRQLAALHDEGADPQKIRALEESIRNQYQSGFTKHHDALTAAAKSFAAKNQIEVAWDVRTRP